MSESVGAILTDTATRLFEDHVTPALLTAAEQGVWPGALWTAIDDIGLPRALVPEEAGGFGMPVIEALVVLRPAGAAALPVPLAETMLANWLLAGAGLPLPEGPLAAVGGCGLMLVPEGAGWHLSGRVDGVPWGRCARAALAMRDGQAFVALLPGDAAQVERGTNPAGEPRDTLRFDLMLEAGMVAPAASGIGAVQLRAAGAVTRSLMISGALQRISDMTVRYAQDRKQFGKPIGRFQAVQQNLAVLAAETAAATAASDLAAEGFANALALPAIAVGKSRAGEAAGIGAAIAHQVHGAIGFTYEHSLHFLTKRLWSWRDEYGTEAEWTWLLGRHVTKAGADRLWAEITAL